MDEFSFSLANFKCEELEATTSQDNQKFSLKDYIERNKIKRVTLYLTTKKIRQVPEVLEIEVPEVPEIEALSDSDESLQDPFADDFSFTQMSSAIQSRRDVIAEQDDAFKRSLEADMAKDEYKRSQLLAELADVQHQEQNANQNRKSS